MGMARRISALGLAFTMAVIGAPLPVQAAGEDPAGAVRGLTLGGQPLSRLVTSTGTGVPPPLASLASQEHGQASGIALPQRPTNRGLTRGRKIARGAAIGGGAAAEPLLVGIRGPSDALL